MWPTEDPTDNSPEQLRWWIPCTGEANENRNVSVLVLGDRVALVLPPGDTLIFDAAEAEDLARVLDGAMANLSRAEQPAAEHPATAPAPRTPEPTETRTDPSGGRSG